MLRSFLAKLALCSRARHPTGLPRSVAAIGGLCFWAVLAVHDLSRSASGGEASAQFLTLNGGARAAAMGGAYAASGDDVGALFYNPAGLAGFEVEM